MVPFKWVIQDNLRKSHDVSKLIDFLEVQGVSWEHIPVIPFDDSPIEGVSAEGLTIFYGSTGLVDRIYRDEQHKNWLPGVWFDPERFAFKAQRDGYKTELLNSDSEVISIRELLTKGYSKDEVFFCRPASDTKEFSGCLMTYGEMLDWNHTLAGTQGRLTFDTVVQIAKPKEIIKEVRTFVINQKVVTGSSYGLVGRGNEVLPADLEYAQEVARMYQPVPVFTLGICVLSDGSRKVVENNCFNCSGLYWCDVYKLVEEVNRFSREQYE